MTANLLFSASGFMCGKRYEHAIGKHVKVECTSLKPGKRTDRGCAHVQRDSGHTNQGKEKVSECGIATHKFQDVKS